MKKIIALIVIFACLTSCTSTKSTIKNIDDMAPIPQLKNNAFVLTQISNDSKYGYDKDYPINVFFRNSKNDTINIERFLNALSGPKGEAIQYKKIDNCCPFPTKKSDIGGGLLELYEVTWQGQNKPIHLYLNNFEKGQLLAPKGFTIKKQ
jgi:hypothetical protein